MKDILANLNLPPSWRDALEASNNGDIPKWLDALERLPDITPESVELDTDAPSAAGGITAETAEKLEAALMELHPWRKGPFKPFGINLDAEWRSNLKWNRIAPHIAPLDGKTVLDVGSGNGYYIFRMVGAGAKAVLGVDTSPLHAIQFQALNKYLRANFAEVLMADFDTLPSAPVFDTVFSMGVIYHRPDPEDHMRRLAALLKPGGQCVVESIVIDEPGEACLKPKGRYANMRNVHAIPSPALLAEWARSARMEVEKIIPAADTTTEEQRPTKWMRFQSLEHALNPANPAETMEGYPAPKRAAVIAIKP